MFKNRRHHQDDSYARNNHHDGTYAAPPPRQGFFSRLRSPHPADQPQYNLAATTQAYGPQNGYGARRFYRDPYYEGSTRSDWDHYAVRHEEALIGDPVPIMNNNLNLAANQGMSNMNGPYGHGPLANGPVNHGYDDGHYDRRHPAFRNLNRNGVPLVGPVTANGPLPGNYASGVVVEKNFVQGPGAARSRTGMIDDPAYQRGWQSAAWGAAPLYDDDYGYGSRGPHGPNSLYMDGAHNTGMHPGSGPMGSTAWGSAPLYGYRDSRMAGRATPLLPDNPWTHNELGRDWEDGYRRGTIPYSSINNAFVQPAVTENFVEYGPNGERIEGYRTRVVREDIVPPNAALGQVTTSNTTKNVKDVVTPGTPTVRSATVMPSVPIPADAVGIPIVHTVPAVEVVKVVPATTVVEKVVAL